MTISHVSIAVSDPKRTAHALAEIWQGQAHPFFPYSGAWLAFSNNQGASQIECYPAGSELVPADNDAGYEIQDNQALSAALTPTHVNIMAPCS